jgi:N-acyl-D-aspartate/D-glutamate deacylase
MRKFISDLLDSIEDIPSDILTKAVNWEWESFPEYMNVLEKKQFACDVGILVGHAAVRSWVLGARVNASDIPNGQQTSPISQDDISKMSKVVEEAIACGALGFSSSRVFNHRDQAGVLLPGTLASHEELKAIGKGIQAGGGGVFELASSWSCYDDWVGDGQPSAGKLREYNIGEWRWVEEMSKLDNVTFTTNGNTGMTKTPNHKGFSKQQSKINNRGGDMYVTPMTRGGTWFWGIEAEVHPLMYCKIYREIEEKYKNHPTMSDMLKELQREDIRKSIIDDLNRKAKFHSGMKSFFMDHLRFVWPWSNDPERKEEDSVKYSMKHTGKDPITFMYDVLTHPEEPHNGILCRPLYNYGTHNMDPLREMFLSDKVVNGFNDAGAHTKIQCEATAPTTMMTFWCRDRTRGPKLPIELVVKKQTLDTATMMGLTDRGVLKPGMRADVNVINMKTLNCLPPKYKNDMPLGAGRWTQDVTGYHFTICNGVVTFENGISTGALPIKHNTITYCKMIPCNILRPTTRTKGHIIFIFWWQTI